MSIKTVRLNNLTFSFNNWFEFIMIYKDIFVLKEYRFKPQTDKPFIIDCGAHIGIPILYFKKVYPQAHIVAFEPNEGTFKLLEKNIEQNNIDSIKLVNAAVYDKNGIIDFYVETNPKYPSWGNSAVTRDLNYGTSAKISVPAVKLSSYINAHVDLLKMDIEGAELTVLHEVEPKLHFVNEIIVELHTKGKDKMEVYNELATLLKNHSFEHTIYKVGIIGKKITAKQIKKAHTDYFIIHAKKIASVH